MKEIDLQLQMQSNELKHYNGKLTHLLNVIAPNRIRCIFSDLDGTLLHPGSKLIEDGYEILNLEEGESVSFSSSSSSRQSDPSNFPLYPLTRLTESSIKSSTAISNKRLQPNIRLLRTRDSKNNLVERIALELPSLSAGPGYISIRTLELLHDLRSKYGCMLILITGARSSTYIYRRCVGLPVADYEIVEGGGRLIHDPISDNSKVLEILETYQREEKAQIDVQDVLNDHIPWSLEWENTVGGVEGSHSSTGIKVDPEQRMGNLWTLYREMKKANWVLDARDYLTSFRVDVNRSILQNPNLSWEDIHNRIQILGLRSSFNLGKADIYCATSGKANAVQLLQQSLNILSTQSAALFDDDNDLGMANICDGMQIAVSITHESVQKWLADRLTPKEKTNKEESSTYSCREKGLLATEEALEFLIRSFTK